MVLNIPWTICLLCRESTIISIPGIVTDDSAQFVTKKTRFFPVPARPIALCISTWGILECRIRISSSGNWLFRILDTYIISDTPARNASIFVPFCGMICISNSLIIQSFISSAGISTSLNFLTT